LKKGQADREEWKRHFEEAAEQERLEIVKQAESADRQSRRRALLEVRNQIIDEVIYEAREKLMGGVHAYKDRFKIVQEGNILLNNSIDAIFEAQRQTLRDKVNTILTAEE